MQTLLQFLLAVVEFFLINWIGRHSISSGYYQISFIQNIEDAPLFNTVFRILAPSVYLVLIATALYASGLDAGVEGLWRVTLFYFVFRWTFNVVLGRTLLLRWSKQVAIAILATALSYVVYDQLLRNRTVVLPSARGLLDQLWIVIIIFLYHTYQQIALNDGDGGAGNRRNAYLKRKYGEFLRSVGDTIRAESESRAVEALAFSILLYEDFNRPAVYRAIERWILFPLGLAKTLGPMQVRTAELAHDEALVASAVRKLNRDFQTSLLEELGNDPVSATIRVRRNADTGVEAPYSHGDENKVTFADLSWWQGRQVITRTAAKYNIRSDYPGQVLGIFNILAIHFYREFTGADE